MTEWTKLLTHHYSTEDTVPQVKVEDGQLYMLQGDEMIIIDVSEFAEFVEGVRDAIREARIMTKLDLPMERVAAAGRTDPLSRSASTDITTPASARAALERETEIGEKAAKIRVVFDAQPGGWRMNEAAAYEAGARAGLSAYRECYELCAYIAKLDPDDIAAGLVLGLVERAEAALEAANG